MRDSFFCIYFSLVILVNKFYIFMYHFECFCIYHCFKKEGSFLLFHFFSSKHIWNILKWKIPDIQLLTKLTFSLGERQTDIHKYTLSGRAITLFTIQYMMDIEIWWRGFEISFFFKKHSMPKNYEILPLSPHVCLNNDLINWLFTKKSIIFYIPKANPANYVVTCTF